MNALMVLIQLMEVPVWLIQTNKHINCTCMDPVSKHGDPFCENCLGLGHKITIREARAHLQPLIFDRTVPTINYS